MYVANTSRHEPNLLPQAGEASPRARPSVPSGRDLVLEAGISYDSAERFVSSPLS